MITQCIGTQPQIASNIAIAAVQNPLRNLSIRQLAGAISVFNSLSETVAAEMGRPCFFDTPLGDVLGGISDDFGERAQGAAEELERRTPTNSEEKKVKSRALAMWSLLVGDEPQDVALAIIRQERNC